ncbi:siderophore esteras-like protein IroE-like protein [Boeremia exigua]|uniref:siderophore esterase-like protein IroE-like protein n=1 Tax=Boeremia exigua TaxID=749465 RepID=UPI001E8DE6FC|nr:siderophore esterase-like protein IroE-like protein [Boeremia exigua]KAH6612743.1 siderophore esteras-like protein IroE-like protein [Boeremia exigua]
MNASIGAWTFSPLLTEFPATVLPNIGFWSVSNGTWEYQIQLAWPLNWTTTLESATVETMYVLDGNAQGLSATEAIRRRRPVEFNQPDTIVVSIGYPESIEDSPYSTSRYSDMQPPVCATCPRPTQPGVPSNADGLITFIETALRPWVQKTVFKEANFNRDALYGHSFAGLFVLYALTVRPDLFDTYLSASPALYWNDDYVFNQTEFLAPLLTNVTSASNNTKPAFQISYGGLEQFPKQRKRESDEEFEFRKSILVPMRMTDLSERLYADLANSLVLRNVDLNVFPNSYHATVGTAAFSDGIDYFLDW